MKVIGLLSSKVKTFRTYASKHWKRLVLILVIIILAFAGYKKITAEPQGVTTARVYKTSLEGDFVANGKVKAKKMADLKFSAPSRVAWINVENGDYIRANQSIAGLDTIALNEAYQQALNSYRNYSATADSVLDSVQGHDTDESFAQRATRTTAEVNRDNAYSAIVATRVGLRNAVLVSPISGTVVDTNDIRAGLNLTGSDLESKYIRIVDLSSFYFEAQIDEVDYSKISKDQTVSIDLDAYPGESCEGSASYIGRDGQETSGGVVTIPVEVTLKNCGLSLAVGLNGQAHFETFKLENVLVIPKKYIVDKNGQDMVWVQTGESTRNRELVQIKVGKTTSTQAQVLEGISEGDKIVYIP